MTLYTQGGYKYQLREDLVLQSSIVGYDVDLPFIRLKEDGALIIKRGYASDGPSGPTFDMWRPRKLFKWLYKKFLMPAVGHDALYQLLRMKMIPASLRGNADMDLRTWCLDRGMWKTRSNWIYMSVSKGAGYAADPKNSREVLDAP